MTEQLAEEVRRLLPARSLRYHPALLSTEAAACAWAREGAPSGAVLLAGYQAAPRRRTGVPWPIPQGGLGFSLVLRDPIAVRGRGFLYVLATLVVAEAMGEGASVSWPDGVQRSGEEVAWVTVVTESGPRMEWAVVTVLADAPPRSPAVVVSQVAQSLDAALGSDPEEVLAAGGHLLRGVGRPVRIRLLPLGPDAPLVEGTVQTFDLGGCMVLRSGEGRERRLSPDEVGEVEVL